MTTERATCWSVTINNPTPLDEEQIALARQVGWKVVGQLEKGVQGTAHYQLMVRTPQVRFSQVKKAFSRGHVEIAKNPSALEAYVHKGDTRVAPLEENQSLFPSLSKLWDMILPKWDDHPPAFIPGRDPGWKRRTEARLEWFDFEISCMIREGYHVETMAMNPAIRGAFARWAPDLMERSRRRQTDRQPHLFSHQENYTQDANSPQENAALQEEADATPRWIPEGGSQDQQIPWHEVHEGDSA